MRDKKTRIINWSDLDEDEEEQEAPKYPEFYEERPKNFRQGTYEYLHKQALANDDARVTTDTFSGVKQFEYRCASCGHGTKQPQIGHKVDWKQHAFSKGAKNRKEVLNWYNDRSNLRFECQDCNTGHTFEEGPDGEYLEWFI